MILITGGVFQGKRELAKRLWMEQRTGSKLRTEPEKVWACDSVPAEREPVLITGEQLSEADVFKADIIADFHLYIRTLLQQGKDAAAETEKLLRQNPKLIFTMAELGCGIVPMEAFERDWRETAGRIGCLLAAQAEAVYRVTCGREQKIK